MTTDPAHTHQLARTSAPYFGVPVEITISGGNITKNDWVGLYDGAAKRITWDWLKPAFFSKNMFKSSSNRVFTHTFRASAFDVSESQGRDGKGFLLPITLKCRLYKDGGWITSGTKVAETEIVLENPLATAAANVVSGALIEVKYTLKDHTLFSGRGLFTVTTSDGVRVSDASLVAGAGVCTVRLPLPRVGGMYKCNCLFGSDGATPLWSAEVSVPASGNMSDVFVRRNKACPRHTSALGSVTLSRPGDPLYFTISPTELSAEYIRSNSGQNPANCRLTSDDMIFITKSPPTLSSERLDGSPSTRELQTPVIRLSIRSDGTCILPDSAASSPSLAAGVYHATLALKHPGAYLAAGTATIIVTPKASAAVDTEAIGAAPNETDGFDIAPFPPASQHFPSDAPGGVSSSPPSQFICVVCCDLVVTQLLKPCNHVCLCGVCEKEMMGKGLLKECPVCRGTVRSTEKVYF